MNWNDKKEVKEFVMEAVKQHGWVLQYVSEKLRNDIDIINNSKLPYPIIKRLRRIEIGCMRKTKEEWLNTPFEDVQEALYNSKPLYDRYIKLIKELK